MNSTAFQMIPWQGGFGLSAAVEKKNRVRTPA